ncbi:MAG: glycosyltransferase family 2 protein [Candidatus Hydrogenedentes bacterium]|nr:glycosyltransferase family 2 protein [Candidatus Hydrogenedentota bacterium]
MRVDIVVVSYNTRDLLAACLNSIAETCGRQGGVRTIVVDNASTDGSAAMVRRISPRIHLIEMDRNMGFGAANNRGIAAGDAPYILLLNSDAELAPGCLHHLVQTMEAHPDSIAVGPRLSYPGGLFHPSCRRFPSVLRSFWNTAGLHVRFPRLLKRLHDWLDEDEHVDGRVVDMVSGACVLVRRDYLNAIGGFDEDVFLYEEEADIFLPARRRRKRVYFCGQAHAIHHHGASSGEIQSSGTALLHRYRSKYFVYRKHRGRIRARLLYWSDRIPFAISRFVAWLRRRTTPATRMATFSRLGFRESFRPIK